MKKLAALCIALIGMVSLTSCMNANANVPDTEDKVTIEMKLDENYDDTDPFINERLFCVSEDLDTLTAEVTFEMDGESGILEVKNNKTNEVLWSNSWEENVKPEYVISIVSATVQLSSEQRMSFIEMTPLLFCVEKDCVDWRTHTFDNRS